MNKATFEKAHIKTHIQNNVKVAPKEILPSGVKSRKRCKKKENISQVLSNYKEPKSIKTLKESKM